MYAIIYITTSNKVEAQKIGETLVKKRLAACANVIEKIYSIYWWKGKMERDDEALLLLKTKDDRIEEVINMVKELHSYENPDITAIPLIGGSKEYLKWIDDEVGQSNTAPHK